MPNSENKEDIQRFQGMANYLCKFIPNYSEITTPLRTLQHNNILSSFDKPQIQAVENLQKITTSSPILQFYNPELQIEINTNASKKRTRYYSITKTQR